MAAENMPIMGYYLTRSKSKWINIFHFPHNPKNVKILRLGGYTCKRQVYSEVFFNKLSWDRLFKVRMSLFQVLEKKSKCEFYVHYLDYNFSVELHIYKVDKRKDKMLCFIQNQDKFYMKRETFINLLSHNEWVSNNLPAELEY